MAAWNGVGVAETRSVGRGVSARSLVAALAALGFSGVLSIPAQAGAAPSDDARRSAEQTIAVLLAAAPPAPDGRVCVMFRTPPGAGVEETTLGAASCARLRERFGRDATAQVLPPEQALEHLARLEQARREAGPRGGTGPLRRT